MKFWEKVFRRDTKKMATVNDRRITPRRQLDVLCNSTFRVNEDVRRAILLDVSLAGARFGSAAAAGAPAFAPEQVVDFDLTTPFGVTTLSGRVVWTSSDSVLYTWGVQFTREPEANRDPMRVLLA